MKTYSDLRIGDKLRTTFGNSLDRVYHLRGKIGGKLILRYWTRSKQRWEYVIEGPEWFSAFKSHLRITR